VNAFIALPMNVRLAALALLGFVVGSLINLGIYSLAWFARPISPWQLRHTHAPPRYWTDFVPVLGWLGLARESSLHGRWFWIRPPLIELACAVAFPALYWWEITGHLAPKALGVIAEPALILQSQFIRHAILLALMLVATFIDFDEKTIPDEITIPGTLCGLLLSAIWPTSALPVVHLLVPAPRLPPLAAYGPLLVTSSNSWPSWINGVWGLVIGLSIYIAWCVALIPALVTLRRGFRKAIAFYFASALRGNAWWKLLLLAVIGSTAIALVWDGAGGRWPALFTSLVGLAFGGGLVWAVRIAGRLALHKEAMGFGDVTLLAMIGAFLGWQPCLMIFFGAPFLALLVAVIQAISTGKRDIPYGPYLCGVAVLVIVFWPWFWGQFGPLFALGWLLPMVLAVCVVLMAAMLTLWRIIESQFFSGAKRRPS
jgi:prepilin signal peptidase PulO-like enzyme (type II secretory pathway)